MNENSEMRLAIAEIESPLGPILVADADDGICALDFADCRNRMEAILRRRYGAVGLDAGLASDSLASAIEGLARYFAGELEALDAIPVDAGGTAFQAAVWSRLRRIPAGSTISYQELAASIGRPAAVRAAGAANARNPVALVIPCHRVIGSSGSLTGYAGGIERKRWLLEHEARAAQSRSRTQLGRKSFVALATSE